MSGIGNGNFYESKWEPLRGGIERVVFAMEADSMSCTLGKIENGHEKKPHTHPNEQVAMVLEGECDYYVDGVPYRLKPGGWVTVPPNVEHYIHVYDSPVPCLQLDIFTPHREEYTESYTKFISGK
jgi:quercetin dioxygenase-like cupin family protein